MFSLTPQIVAFTSKCFRVIFTSNKLEKKISFVFIFFSMKSTKRWKTGCNVYISNSFITQSIQVSLIRIPCSPTLYLHCPSLQRFKGMKARKTHSQGLHRPLRLCYMSLQISFLLLPILLSFSPSLPLLLLRQHLLLCSSLCRFG